MTEQVFKDENAMKHILSRTPLGRTGEPSDLKAAPLHAASPTSNHVTGQTIFVDGGWTTLQAVPYPCTRGLFCTKRQANIRGRTSARAIQFVTFDVLLNILRINTQTQSLQKNTVKKTCLPPTRALGSFGRRFSRLQTPRYASQTQASRLHPSAPATFCYQTMLHLR
jgi:hypothetical protein